MKLNMGIAKAIVSSKITDEFINESKLIKNNNLMSKFIKTIKESPILMNEFIVVNNIENKYIDSDVSASKFIDRNVNTFSKYTKNDITEAYKKLESFINEESLKGISESKINLYSSISTLITESHNPNGDINEIHDAYDNVLNYIKNNVNNVNESDTSFNLDKNINIDSVVKIATKKYNEKYSTLTENQRKLVNTLVYGSKENKSKIFEELKEVNIKKLSSIDNNGIEDKINEAIDRVKKMTYSESTINKNIIELANLQENLN